MSVHPSPASLEQPRETQPSAPRARAPSIEQSLSRLATTHPAASRIFQQHGLDFCCQGNRSLSAACSEHALDAESILDQILLAEVAPVDFDQLTLDELIDHVLIRYHEPARKELPDLLSMAQRVETRHRDKPGCPHGLAALLSSWGEDLLDHMHKEEQVLFPLFRSASSALASTPVRVMEAEHQEHGSALRKIRELTDDLNAPQHACPTWRALYLRLIEFERDVMAHVAFEQDVLFPRGLTEGV